MDRKIMGQIFKYFIPVGIAYLMFATSTLIDGVFVSTKFGDQAVAAMSIVQPLYLLAYSFAFSLQIGSQTYVGIKLGEKDHEHASQIFSGLVVKSAITCVVLAIGIKLISISLYPIIVNNVGLDVANYAKEYIDVYLLCIPFFGPMLIMTGCLKSEEQPKIMMTIALIGTIINIILNYCFLFILDGGIWGSALSTAISVLIQFSLSLVYYIKYSKYLKFKKFKIDMGLYVKALVNGSSDGMIDVSIAIRSALSNYILLVTIGVVGVAAAGYINYVYTLLIIPVYALADAISPFISKSYGAKDFNLVQVYRRNGIYLAIIMCLIITGFMLGFRDQIFLVFHIDDASLYQYLMAVSVIQFSSLIFSGYNQNQIAYLTAIDHGKTSFVASFIRNLLIISILIIIFAELFGDMGLWSALVVSEFISAIIIHFLVRKINKQELEKFKINAL